MCKDVVVESTAAIPRLRRSRCRAKLAFGQGSIVVVSFQMGEREHMMVVTLESVELMEWKEGDETFVDMGMAVPGVVRCVFW